MEYLEFIGRKSQVGGEYGFAPLWIPDAAFDFQRALIEWSLRRGRAALFADTGMGKSLMQLVWAENVVRKTNGRVLILTPIAVGAQTVAEGERFGIGATRTRDGKGIAGAGIYVTNYEQLHHYDSADFAALVCDESSIIKSYRGATQIKVKGFAERVMYTLLCTATAAPNDFTELGTSSEVLRELPMLEMLARFFKMDEKVHVKNEREKRLKARMKGERFEHRKVIASTGSSWRLKGHAEAAFWRWVASWARACRKPSDLGFSDEGFVLPPLTERHHVVVARTLRDGMLFARPAFGLSEEREERRRTLAERVEAVAKLVDHGKMAIVWCALNDEGDALERAIPGAVQVAGRDSEELKEDRLLAFARGEIRVLITKAKIGGWGLNLQKCAHVVTFATNSYEAHYQQVRRCWRYGQKSSVTVDVVATEGESGVVENMKRKAEAASRMFEELVKYMNDSIRMARKEYTEENMEVPAWLRKA